jgi:hypothetical protein
MHFDQINWLYVAGGISSVLLIAWIIAAFRARPGAVALLVGLAHLVVAGLNSAAPLRGVLDPAYVGYGFGMATASHGPGVSLVAGAVFIAAVVGAFTALRRIWLAYLITAITSLGFLTVLGWPWLADLLDGFHTSFQIGEGLIIPGFVAKGAFAIIILTPFALGAVRSLFRLATPAPDPAQVTSRLD